MPSLYLEKTLSLDFWGVNTFVWGFISISVLIFIFVNPYCPVEHMLFCYFPPDVPRPQVPFS
jgi:hypothetical protein